MNFSYYIFTVLQLIGVIIITLALATIITYSIIKTGDFFLRPFFFKSYPLLASWNFLRAKKKSIKKKYKISFQSFISIIGVAIGVWALIVVLSVMGGFEKDLKEKIVHNTPHILIEKENGIEAFSPDELLLSEISHNKNVLWVLPYIEEEVIAGSPTNISTSLLLKGIDPDGEFAKKELNNQIIEGSLELLKYPVKLLSDRELGLESTEGLLQEKKTKEIILPSIFIGSELANSLSVGVGGEIQIISPQGEISPVGLIPKSKLFKIGGIFQTGMYEYDLKLAYIKLGTAEKFFGFEKMINKIDVRIKDMDKIDDVKKFIINKIKDTQKSNNWKVKTWDELNKSLFSAMKLEKVAMFLILGFIILVASFNITGSLMMIILQRSKEITIFRCLGSTKGGIMKTFLLVGLIIGFSGAVVGTLLGIFSCIFIEKWGIQLPKEYYIREIPVDMRAVEFAFIIFLSIAITLIATIFPSIIAGRMSAVKGLKNE